MAVRPSHFTSVTVNPVDFDFFGPNSFDPTVLRGTIPFMRDAQITQQAPNTLTGIVDRGGPIKVSFFGLPHLKRIQPLHEVAENGLKVASLVDLAGTKAHVVQARAEAKDYIDIDALIRVGKVDLPTSLAAAQAVFGPDFNPQITLKALSFFDEGNLRGLPDDMKSRLAAAARDVDLDKLPDPTAEQQRDTSRGLGR
ncbi:nucleotidyl transferase AbiEii/AbiGii toxin family protein [Bradyrhizobium sp. BR 1433]|uniref:nucleotidyl transferase AbiEii/AbiGii toxin family protein n=1 Tax=Bradyrhizobium sp. BR 1433 TaxID=3447967 RepID=UPI003EE619E8